MDSLPEKEALEKTAGPDSVVEATNWFLEREPPLREVVGRPGRRNSRNGNGIGEGLKCHKRNGAT